MSEHFGKDQVFRDIDRIEPGRDYVTAIESSVASCDALLVLIGRQWLTVEDENGRRLHDPDDFVRLEVSKALQREVPVIPVLIPGADKMPDAKELPDDMAELARRQAIKFTDETWDFDIQRLTKALEKIGVRSLTEVGDAKSPKHDGPAARKPKVLWLIGGAFAAIIAVVMIVAFQGSGTLESLPTEDFQADLAQNESPEVSTPSRESEVQPLKSSAPRPSEIVQTAQNLLMSLGYDPGSADGLQGAKTTAAVRDFQEDRGLTANGRINRRLIEELDAALEDAEAYDSLAEANYATPPSPVTAIDLSGNWYDNSSIPYTFVQNGNQVFAEAYNPMTGAVVGTMEGTVSGAVLNYRYVTAFGTSGVGQATMEPDGRHMTVTVRDAGTGMTTNDRMHRGHTPQ